LKDLDLVPRAQLLVKLREGGASMGRKPNFCEAIMAAVKAFFNPPAPVTPVREAPRPPTTREWAWGSWCAVNGLLDGLRSWIDGLACCLCVGDRGKREDDNGNSTMLDAKH
jgi:hypothetical protein